ncbi:hypothetical protein GWI34_27880 [Actinomadura sp. DSM 109109]|nr:hypothetical protein [Actinomadura lepetitiana]
MRGVTNLLTVLVAALVGGITCGVTITISMVGVISAEEAPGTFMLSGAVGAFFAVIAAAVIVSFGKAVRSAFLGAGLGNFVLAGCMFAFGVSWAPLGTLGFSLLAGVFADFIARRPGAVEAAGTAASQGQDPTSSGAASQR